MITINQQSVKKKQDGIALLVLVITLALTISAYYFSNISITEIQADKSQDTQLALKQAKQLLLGYAATRADLTVPSPQPGRYGYLPCPANNNGEGNSVANCGNTNANTLGWFPWKSLGASPVKDGNGSCLLYAVSGDYKAWPSSGMLNEDTNGLFRIVDEMGVPVLGNTPADRVVAVIFSAGDALTGQDRNFLDDTQCGNDIDNFSAYLDSLEVSPGDIIDNSAVETGNADEVYRIVQAATATNKAVINDRFITISRNEIWSAITARSDLDTKMSNLTEALAVCLSDYAAANGKNRLPWPAPMDLADYRPDDNYDDNADATPGYAGRFPYIVTDSNNDIVIAAADDALFTEAACDSLVLPTGSITVDLLAPFASEEYINLWKNWKDHIFYVVSQEYAPASTTVDIVTPPCSPGDCITVNGTEKAAAVIFAGSSVGQIRTGPPDANTKDDIDNYIENNNAVFKAATGNGAYVTGGNDIMFCIDTGLGVVPC